MSEYGKIYLVGYQGRYEEAEAAAEVKPGHLLTLTSEGKVQPHATAGGYAERAFAVERSEMGQTIDDAYAQGDQVKFVLAMPGDVVWAFLKNGQTVSVGDLVTSAGDGTLKVKGDTDIPVGVVLEALDLSGASEPARVKIRLL